MKIEEGRRSQREGRLEESQIEEKVRRNGNDGEREWKSSSGKIKFIYLLRHWRNLPLFK